MKKTVAFVMALAMMSTMFTACGGKTETDDTSSQAGISVEEGTKASGEAEAETETETEAETEAETVAETASASLLDGVTFADTPSFVVTDHDVEIGDWEGYIEKFEMPENIVMSVAVSDKENIGMVFGLANGTTMFRLNFEAPASSVNEDEDDKVETEDETTSDEDSEGAEENDTTEAETAEDSEPESKAEESTPVPVSYTLYATEDAIYTYMVVDGETDAKKGDVSSDDDSESSVEDTLSSYDASNDKFTFKEYGNKETIDGKDYDVIICSMTKDDKDEDIDAKLYFDENGGFYKLSYEEESGKAELYEAKSIDIPDADFEEAEAAELSMSLLGMIFTFAFSSMDDAIEDKTIDIEPAPGVTVKPIDKESAEDETAISEEASASEE